MVLTEYQFSAPLAAPLKLALAADLHERAPEDVLECLREAKPDLICLAGDIMERHDTGENPRYSGWKRKAEKISHFFKYSIAEALGVYHPGRSPENAWQLLQGAAQIAPVFYSMGNHEWYFTSEDRERLQDLGVTLLENSDITWNNISIGGLSPAGDPEWLKRFAARDGFKILLSHHPEDYKKLIRPLDIDLVLSAHAHGGQIRIGRQGFYAPGQGFFPRYTKGVYDKRMIVTTGCANTAFFPRWGNPCEVVLIHLETVNNNTPSAC